MTISRAEAIATMLLMRQSPVPVDIITTLIEGGIDYRALEARYSI